MWKDKIKNVDSECVLYFNNLFKKIDKFNNIG